METRRASQVPGASWPWVMGKEAVESCRNLGLSCQLLPQGLAGLGRAGKRI